MEKKEKKKFKIQSERTDYLSVNDGDYVCRYVCLYAFGWHEQCDDSRYEHYAYIISNKNDYTLHFKRTRYSFLLFKCL